MGWKRSPKLLISKLEKIKKQVVRETGGETGKVVRYLDNDTKRKVFPAKNVSKQDSPSGLGFRQGGSKASNVRIDWSARADGIVITLGVFSHYTGARTAAMISILTKLGRQDQLKRQSLIVKRRGKGGQQRLSFASYPSLQVWADRRDKGEQIRRHVVLLDKAIMLALILAPVLEKNTKRVIEAWKRGLQKGFF